MNVADDIVKIIELNLYCLVVRYGKVVQEDETLQHIAKK